MKARRGRRIGLWLLPVVFLLPFFSQADPSLAADKVRFGLSWLPYGRDAGFYAALAQGYYRDQGLEVTIQRGFGSGNALKTVVSGGVDVTQAGLDSMVVARARGLKVMAIAVWHARSPHVIYTLKGSGILGPKDLAGRTIGVTANEAGHIIFPAFAAKAGIDPVKVKFRNMEGASKNPSLAAGAVDAIIAYVTTSPAVESAAAKAGKEVVPIKYADHGVDIYSDGTVVTKDTLKKGPDVVRRFLNATYRGALYAVENPEEAVRQFVKMEPANDLRISLKTWAIAVELLVDEVALKEGLGHISKDKMAYTRDLMVKYMKLPLREPVEELYTNAYLPRLVPKRR